MTALLGAVRNGHGRAVDELFRLLYDELHDLAHRQLSRGRPGETLNTTALVHEAYLKLVRGARVTLNDRNHFLALAATAMRHVIVDYARMRRAAIRGGDAAHVPLDENEIPVETRIEDLLALHAALVRLEQMNPRLAKVVELLYFGGLSVEEAAEVMGTSPRTVKRDWRKARAFLLRMLRCE